MKNSISIPILACALCALPAMALANSNDDAKSRPEPARPVATERVQASFYRQPAPAVYRAQAPVYREQPRPVQPMPHYLARQVVSVSVVSPHFYAQAWQWNGGAAWYPRPAYWGGGFWGNFALGVSFNNYNYGGYGGYIVQQQSPGAQLLANYQLTQTSCDQPNLVDILGPDGSEICAYPNNMVSPGAYDVDYATLTLNSTNQ